MTQITLRSAISAATPVVIVLMSTAALAQQTPQYPGPYYWHGWHGWFFGPIMMIVFIAVTVVVVVSLVRWLGGQGHSMPPRGPLTKTPLDILKERFACGEIDKEEFEKRRSVLGD